MGGCTIYFIAQLLSPGKCSQGGVPRSVIRKAGRQDESHPPGVRWGVRRTTTVHARRDADAWGQRWADDRIGTGGVTTGGGPSSVIRFSSPRDSQCSNRPVVKPAGGIHAAP